MASCDLLLRENLILAACAYLCASIHLICTLRLKSKQPTKVPRLDQTNFYLALILSLIPINEIGFFVSNHSHAINAF
jgi:hypothetical protein